MSDDHGIRSEWTSAGVLYVTIDRPDVANALDGPCHNVLNDLWNEAQADRSLRAVVVTGSGDRVFCAGADMSRESVPKSGAEYWTGLNPNGFGGLSLRRSLDIPVIGRVNGHAAGGGMEMLFGCDIIVAASHAKFGLTEPRVGRMPLDGGIASLVRCIPRRQAMELLLTGRMATAEEMYRFGFVNEVVEGGELDVAVQRWIAEIFACSPISVRAIKQVLNRTEHLTPPEAANMRVPALMDALDSEDSIEGVEAFRAKRQPKWAP